MIKVLGDRVLVALAPRDNETTTASGLIIMKDPELRSETQGIVMALGEKTGTVLIDEVCAILKDRGYEADKYAAIQAMRPAPFDVAVGDCVLFARGVGELIEDLDIRYLILHEYEIFGVLEPRGYRQTCERCGDAYYGDQIHQCKDYVPAWATQQIMIGAK